VYLYAAPNVGFASVFLLRQNAFSKAFDSKRICTYIRCVYTFVKDRRAQLFSGPLGRASQTQFSILAKPKRLGPLTINALAKDTVMDRTTLSRNVLSLERDGLIKIEASAADGRAKELHLTKAGDKRLQAGSEAWAQVQTRFEIGFGVQRAAHLRVMLAAVTKPSMRCSTNATTLPRNDSGPSVTFSTVLTSRPAAMVCSALFAACPRRCATKIT
jgi:DNA-binding MarR family transcriptional regulator